MNLTSSAARRIAAAAIMTCAAFLLPAAALAAPQSVAASGRQNGAVAVSAVALSADAVSAAAGPAVAAKCATADLTVWMGTPGDGAAGSSYYELQFSNTSSHACTILGFPGVSALDVHGHQLGNAAGRDHSDAAQLVTLGRGETAHVLIRVVDTGALPNCHPSAAVTLRIYPPDDSGSVSVPFSFSACKRHGPVYLFVRATMSGTGIPGFSG
jgi:Protein of unknown function (DUF4232)